MTAQPPALSRAAGHGRPAPPVRLLHLGMGNFFRAHQAWYTHRAEDAASWGIAAFTGRSPGLCAALSAQDGLYTLVTRGSAGDHYETVSSIVTASPGTDSEAWLAHWRRPELGVVTLTVTEAGYTRRADGSLDLDNDDVAADIAALRAGATTAAARTAVGKVLAGLAARAEAGEGPVALVPCDNLPHNGAVLETALREMAACSGRPELSRAVARNASFVTTMVDRITPAPTDDDRTAVLHGAGVADQAPVVTEPFTEWILSGGFPAGRPRWDTAGARFVDDVTPYEERKLWLLNGGHPLLAYAGSLRGHTTVADAVADPVCRGWLAQWWSEATAHLTLPASELAAYQEALLDRFRNPRIRHALAQIASDGSQKLPVRILPVLRRERAAGALPGGAVRVLAAWVCHLRGAGAPVSDAGAGPALQAAKGALPSAVRGVLASLDDGLAADEDLVSAVLREAEALTAR